MSISKVLFFRRGFGISQSALAEKLEISRPTLNKKEKGEIDWTISEMMKIEKIFKKFDCSVTKEKIFFEHNFTK